MKARLFLVTSILATTCGLSGPALAATYNLSFTGAVADFTESHQTAGNLIFDSFDLPLTETSAALPITLNQGDTVNSTVTLDQAYTVPQAPTRTDLLQFLTGANFPVENTEVMGTFTFYYGATALASVDYDSTTSMQISSFMSSFNPYNVPLTLTSFTNDFTIYSLPTAATVEGSSIEYSLVSTAAPEPATWAMLLLGFAGLGLAGYRRARAAA